ncbi:NAD(P)-dependent oxidoreductase [Ferruginibacter sp.]
MNMIVFGAGSITGKQLVQQALLKGHTVKAFGRNVFSEFEQDTKNLLLVKGALFDEGEVATAIKGCDAVLSALGGSNDTSDKTRTLGIKNIIAQMKKNGVARIVAVADKAVLNADENTLIVDTEAYPKENVALAKEQEKVYDSLKDSGLDWTLLCPPAILPQPATGIFNTRADYPPEPDNDTINAGDLALCMLNAVSKNEFVKQRVGISN